MDIWVDIWLHNNDSCHQVFRNANRQSWNGPKKVILGVPIPPKKPIVHTPVVSTGSGHVHVDVTVSMPYLCLPWMH